MDLDCSWWFLAILFGSHWFLVVHWCFFEVVSGSCGSLVLLAVLGGDWWFLVVLSGSWWFLVVLGVFLCGS